jgi:hypothetical protein
MRIASAVGGLSHRLEGAQRAGGQAGEKSAQRRGHEVAGRAHLAEGPGPEGGERDEGARDMGEVAARCLPGVGEGGDGAGVGPSAKTCRASRSAGRRAVVG